MGGNTLFTGPENTLFCRFADGVHLFFRWKVGFK
jgi:hypothetical protein